MRILKILNNQIQILDRLKDELSSGSHQIGTSEDENGKFRRPKELRDPPTVTERFKNNEYWNKCKVFQLSFC